MGPDVASPVGWQPRLRSRNVERIDAYLAANGFRLAIDPRHARRLELRTRGVRLPGLYLASIQYGAPVAVTSDPGRDDYWILLPIRGALEATGGRHCVQCDQRRAAVLSYPVMGSSQVRAPENGARLMVKMTAAAVTRELAALLGRRPDVPLELAPQVSLAEGYGRSLAGYLRLGVADFERGDGLLQSPLAISAFEHFIMAGLLLSHPHNYSEALQRLDRPIAPRAVKRAIDYIETHLDAPVTLSDIVDASGVPGRTLFKHFKDYRGTSPMSYLRSARLARARDDLRRGEPTGSVMEIAMNWGFEHMGRFAVE